MRFVLGCLLVAVLLAPVGVCAADEAPVAPAPAGTLGEIETRLGELAKRIADLVAVAKQDPAERKIEIYAKYKPKDLKSTRGRIRADELVEWMCDPKKNFNVREKAQKVLTDARFRGDPDLSDTDKQGSRTKRAHFCNKYLTKHLRDDDRGTRKLVHELLLIYYPDARRQHSEIREFADAVEKSWKPAQNAWRRFLQKR